MSLGPGQVAVHHRQAVCGPGVQRLPSSSQLLAVKLAEDLQEKKALTWWNLWVKGRWETTDCASVPSQRQGPRGQSDG